MYFYKSKVDDDGRYLSNLASMVQDILDSNYPYCVSTANNRKWANVLLQMYKEACYETSVYAEWHHITPICMFGSIEDFRNYIRIRPELDLMVHAVLC